MKLRWELSAKALEMWHPEIRAAQEDKYSINIYEQIGEDFFSSGVTAKLVSSILRNAKGENVTVNINSAGGDMFEGLAIYNILRDYEGDVTVRVLGMAASAASIIAMAGDKIEIADSGFLMIHNCWSFVAGNKTDLLKIADDFRKFDDAMAGIYANKTGKTKEEIASLMEAETWLGGNDAVSDGFADAILNNNDITENKTSEAKALRKVDVALAKSGMTRSERRNLIKELTSMPSATEQPTPSASDEELTRELKALLAKLNTR